MGAIASQTTSLKVVFSTVYSDADQRKHQSSPSPAFVRGIHRGPVNSPHKWPVTRKMFPFDDVIMIIIRNVLSNRNVIMKQFKRLYIFLLSNYPVRHIVTECCKHIRTANSDILTLLLLHFSGEKNIKMTRLIWNVAYMRKDSLSCTAKSMAVDDLVTQGTREPCATILDWYYQHDDVIKWKHFPRNWVWGAIKLIMTSW